ncbi:MAG: patatin-like phospholipase family protein [Bacteroidota bacterium]
MFKKSKKYKIGMALSGGGARGYAHLGILKALKEKGIVPDAISGTSAGAIAGAFISAGKEPEEAFEIIKGYRFFDLKTIRLPRSGLFSLDKIKDSIEKELTYDRIENLPIPLFVAVTDMLEGKMEYFSEGPLSHTVQASSSIPVLFSPVEIEGKLYSDGGVLDNLPLKPLVNCCKKTIIINISPIRPIKEIKNLVQVATRMFQLSINARDSEKKELCNFYIEPPDIERYDFLDTKHAREIFDVGYNYARDLEITL